MNTIRRSVWILAAAGTIGLWMGAQNAASGFQHGHRAQQGDDHLEEIWERLALSGDQKESLDPHFHEAFAAMQRLHELHDLIAAELNEEQKQKLAVMVHEAFNGSGSKSPHDGGRHR